MNSSLPNKEEFYSILSFYEKYYNIRKYYNMAYGNRKRNYRGRRRPYRKHNSKAKNKQTVAIVKRVLHSNIENKQAFRQAALVDVATSMPASIVAGMYPVIPQVFSSLDGDNSKVGQTIKPMSLRLGMTAFLNTLTSSNNANIYFDLYVFKINKIKDQTLYDSVGPGEVSRFFRPSIAGSDTLYEARNYNWFQNINKDVITPLHKKRFKMAPTKLAGTSNLDGNWNDNYTQTSINYTVPLSKHLLKTLKYTNGTDDTCNNCAIFATMVATPAQATDLASTPAVYGSVSFNSCMVYEDA